MFEINNLQRRTEAHDIEAQLNAIKKLQVQHAFIAGRQACRKKDIRPGLWTDIFMTGVRRIIDTFKRIYSVKYVRREFRNM